MAKNAMPVSKAKTAYGLLSEIRKLILEEPKRYDQNYDLLTGDMLASSVVRPECGTVGCVAGWCAVLKGPQGRRTHPFDVPHIARGILGIDRDAFARLYDYTAVAPRNEVGLEEHAKLGAAHIAKFQKKYAKQLKAKKV